MRLYLQNQSFVTMRSANIQAHAAETRSRSTVNKHVHHQIAVPSDILWNP